MSEADGFRSREAVTVISGQNLKAGAVVGKITCGAVTTDATGNTGAGTITMDSTNPVLIDGKPGAYVITCINAPGSNGGAFIVKDPDGIVIGHAKTGTAFAGPQIKFTIADSGDDFVLYDKFTVTVAAGSGKVTAVPVATAVNGSSVAYGVLLAPVNATSGDKPGVVIRRDAEVNSSLLVFTTSALATLTSTQLGNLGVIVR